MGGVSPLIKSNIVPKCLELILAVASIAVVVDGDPMLVRIPTLATVYGTQIGFIMIGVIVVHSYLFDHHMHKMILLLVGVAGLAMWATTGSMIVHHYRQSIATAEPMAIPTKSPVPEQAINHILKIVGPVLGRLSPRSEKAAIDMQALAGVFCIQAKPDDRLLISGIVALINALVYLIDVVIMVKM